MHTKTIIFLLQQELQKYYIVLVFLCPVQTYLGLSEVSLSSLHEHSKSCQFSENFRYIQHQSCKYFVLFLNGRNGRYQNQEISSPLPLINIQDLHCLMPDPWSTQHQPGLLSFLCCFEPLGNLICITSQPEKRGSGHQSLRVTAFLLTRKVAENFFQAPRLYPALIYDLLHLTPHRKTLCFLR